MAKVYAVKEGRKKGVFTSWDECQEHIKGYKGAQFKSFKTMEEANEYLGIKGEDKEESNPGLSLSTMDEIKWLLEQIVEQTWCGQGELVEQYAGNIADALDIKISITK